MSAVAPISIRVQAGGGQQCVIEISPDEPVESLMALIEVEIGVPMHHQRLTFMGNQLKPNLSLREQGVAADSTVHLQQQSTSAGERSSPPPQQRSGGASLEDQVAQLFGGTAGQGPPPAPSTNPVQPTGWQPSSAGDRRVDEQVRRLFAQPPGTQAAMREQLQRLLAQQQPPLDPLDPEYQRRMYEQIQQQNMQENLEQALEHTPEAFARVVMLYVRSTVNKIPVTAFVDSGAQMTIMNEATAERCGIMRLLDRRMSGIAKGVGTSRILGRIHMTMVELGGIYVPMSITVIESQDMEFLIGLDQLRRHRMCIDLDRNCLRLQDKEIPFLSEGELPERLRAEPEPAEAPPPPPAASLPPQQPDAQAASRPSADQQREGKIQRLMQLSGAARNVVEGALDAAEGNEDVAAGLLFE